MISRVDDLARELREADMSNGLPIEDDTMAPAMTRRTVLQYHDRSMLVCEIVRDNDGLPSVAVPAPLLAPGNWQRVCYAMLNELERGLGSNASNDMLDALSCVRSYIVSSNFGLANIPW